MCTWKEGGAPGKKRGAVPPFPPLGETLLIDRLGHMTQSTTVSVSRSQHYFSRSCSVEEVCIAQKLPDHL